jgi:hypothetical protein
MFLRDEEDNIKMAKIIIDLAFGCVNSVKLAPGKGAICCHCSAYL